MIYDVQGSQEEQERALWVTEVRLDGRKVEQPIYADTEAGIVRRYDPDPKNPKVPRVDPETMKVVIIEERGRVEVDDPSRP